MKAKAYLLLLVIIVIGSLPFFWLLDEMITDLDKGDKMIEGFLLAGFLGIATGMTPERITPVLPSESKRWWIALGVAIFILAPITVCAFGVYCPNRLLHGLPLSSTAGTIHALIIIVRYKAGWNPWRKDRD